MEEIKKRILEFMREGSERPLSYRDLVRALDVPREERERFKRAVKEMASDGTLVRIRGGRFGLPSKMNLATGELICHPDGFGFVRPAEGEDIFISPRKLMGAMHGDTVVARVEPVKVFRKGGKKEGRIIRIAKRAHSTIVGRYRRQKGFGVVVPADERIIQEIIIPPRDRNGAEDGMMVSAEITRFPTAEVAAAGRITDLLGDPEDPDVEAEVILRQYGLPSKFPPHVVHEVRGIPMEVGEEDIRGRKDLRGQRTFTIDGETAKDFDDAVSIERTSHGWRLLVSIADVSHYVREGSELDREAFARGTSVYFPDRCIPMLPEALSNGICSLNPGVDRLTMTAEIEFNGRGEPVKKHFYESVIRSAERLTYTSVKKVLEGGDAELTKRYSHIAGDLREMKELALLLMDRRSRDGSIDFDLPEPQIIIDIEGKVEDIVRSERNIAHRIIEEFMLAANRAVAEEFSRGDIPFLYRVHEEPDRESMEEFREFVAGFGYHLRAGGPKALQELLSSAAGKPEERLINHVLLRSMKQAVYSDVNIGHFGLAFTDYTHFTSPIRRYPDLVVHRLLKLLIHRRYTEKLREKMAEELPEIAASASNSERKAMEAEREIVDLKKAQFMKDKVGDVFEGFISGVTSFGFFVELKEYFVEGLVHVSTLLDDYYVYEEKRHSLRGEHAKRVFRLGDEVTVKLSSVDIERKRLDFVLEGDGTERAPGGRKVRKRH